MTTLIEKDSPLPALLLLGAVFIFLTGSVLGLAYMGGVFTDKNAVIKNDKRIAKQELLKSAPSSAPGTAQP